MLHFAESDEEAGTWRTEAAAPFRRCTDVMWRGSQQRPDKQPGCRMGTLYGGPVRALKRGD